MQSGWLPSEFSCADGTVKLWRPDGTLLKTIKQVRNEAFSGVNEVTFSPDGKMIVSASDDGTIKFWSRDGKFRFFRSHYA
jgi:WD40 repeat protein